MQPPDRSTPRWSPDGMYWWDGSTWIPASQLPVPPPPPVPPSYYLVPPPASRGWGPSPGLRPFLIAFLAVDALVSGLLGLAGIAGETQSPDAYGLSLLALVLANFVLAVASLVAVFRRTSWARWVAIAAGIGITVTCLGAVIGIPIIVSASRAPLGKPTAS